MVRASTGTSARRTRRCAIDGQTMQRPTEQQTRTARPRTQTQTRTSSRCTALLLLKAGIKRCCNG